MENGIQSTSAPFSLTEDQLYRLQRATDSLEIMANLLGDIGEAPEAYRKVSGILDLTREDLERLVCSIEKTYVA